ncbi:kinesin, putative [Bodo saltans]|uniref:Kinesin-like protein n=1 Tax=Bodo saltans TaxID=75058 RepID=A0A0S4INA4_BODSA|nr:kinesin, putative [Bodo saltans]|eukprot:CUE81680.1 kinesin, putative [Bodo saltans]
MSSKKSSIEVAIRVRPMRNELSESKCVWDIQNTRLTEKSNPDCTFMFERVYNSNATTLDLYNSSVKGSIIKNVAQGYNGTVFAYGQTGSGKSFTMLGGGTGPGSEGVVSMAIGDLFVALEEEKAKAKSAGDGLDIQVFISMLEIYNEQLRDLLVAPGQVAAPLTIRENEHGVYVHNATKRPVTTTKQALFIIHNEAESRRTSAATAMNERSSRSHCLIRIHVEKTLSFDADSDDSDSDGESAPAGLSSGDGLKKKIVSSLNLVDLAGSERIAKTGAVGQRMVEGGHINKSLTSLTLVIKTLTDPPKPGGGPTFVNYRDSKLTHLLKTAIGGNSFTTVFCCMTMAEQHVDESRSTLQFAARAKTIKNEVSMNEIGDSRTKIRELETHITRLKRTMVAMDIYLMAKKLKIRLLTSGGEGGGSAQSAGGAAATTTLGTPKRTENSGADFGTSGSAALQEQVAQLQLIVEQLSLQNEELHRDLEITRQNGGGGGNNNMYADPHALGIADGPETHALRNQVAELEQELQDALGERDDLQDALNELDDMCKELEEENTARTGEINQLQHRNRTLDNQVTSLKSLEQSLTKQVEQIRQQLHESEQRTFERARGDELLEQLTKLHVEHQTLQFEHNTLMDLYSREEVEKAATADMQNDRLKELEHEKDEMRAQLQLQNSYLWRLLSVSALATHGKPVDPDDIKASVREHQVESAVKSLTAFVSSRMNRPPGVVGNDDDDDDDGPGTPKSWIKASRAAFDKSSSNNNNNPPADSAKGAPPAVSSSSSTNAAATTLVGDEALQKRIRELEQQIVAKDAQRDIIIDTKLKRIQELVLRLHTTNTKLTQELHTLGAHNNELFEIIKKEPKLLHKLNKTNLTPFNETDAVARASFAPVPQKPFGHN